MEAPEIAITKQADEDENTHIYISGEEDGCEGGEQHGMTRSGGRMRNNPGKGWFKRS